MSKTPKRDDDTYDIVEITQPEGICELPIRLFVCVFVCAKSLNDVWPP